MGCYLAPENTLTIECVVAKFKKHPQVAELLVAGTGGEKILWRH